MYTNISPDFLTCVKYYHSERNLEGRARRSGALLFFGSAARAALYQGVGVGLEAF